MTQEHKISQKTTWVQLETLIAFSVTILAIGGSYLNLTHQVSGIDKRVAKLETNYNAISQKLDAIIQAQIVDSHVSTFRYRDRWTAQMQKDFQDQWYEIVRRYHPEIDKATIPNVNGIQAEYPEGRVE